MNILFVTWDGPQVSYLESLFLPIFCRLQERGVSVHVLQFTWGKEERLRATKEACERAGVPYRLVEVVRRPRLAGGLYTLLKGVCQIVAVCRQWSIDIVMPRSILPIAMVMVARRIALRPLLFDADGLSLDERVEFAGRNPQGFTYRFLRDLEAQAVRASRIVLVRTSKAAEILLARSGAGSCFTKFHVVTNGRDASQFTPGDEQSRLALKHELGVPAEAALLVYSGSLGDQYCVREMLGLFAAVKRTLPDAYLLVLTGSPEKLVPVLSEFGVLANAILIKTLPAGDVPAYVACADLGLALRRSSFSMQGVAPIKIGEYLLCGVPVVASAGVGDTHVLTGDLACVLPALESENLAEAAQWFVNDVLPDRETIRHKCRRLGEACFSLEQTVEGYFEAIQAVNR